MTNILLLLIGLLLTVGTGVFVAAEFSMVALDPAAVEAQAKDDPKARRVAKRLKHLSLYLSACQVGITLTTILLGYVAQAPLTEIFARWLGHTGLAQTAALAIAAAGAFIIVNLFSMLFGELVPKNMALANSLHTAELVSKPLHWFTVLFKPIIIAFNNAANWLLRKFGIEPAEEASSARSATELGALVRQSAAAGTLEPSTAELLTASIGVGRLTAVDIMTDRGRVHYIPDTASAADVVALAAQTGFSRFPVTGEKGLDDIRGLVHLRRAVAVPYERRAEVAVTSSSLMSEAPVVPETMDLSNLLLELRDTGLQMAIVVDEYGGTSGIVSLEDAVEEIVGEIADEHDPDLEPGHRTGSGTWVVSGLVRPDELLKAAGVALPEDGPYETLGGLIMTKLGRLPAVGDQVRVDRVTLTVLSLDGRRVEEVEVRADDAETSGSAADGSAAAHSSATAEEGSDE
ncbi:Hemolysin, contains CBS domains [Actinobaculum suis]|uniref:Hemolysin family protein n=1 Tax=Actinobaculum suis TaxID=1657 RepID=A0A1G7CEW9_9ACTO|nr:hemolysin family protein [Actinobaculum suis]MDY5152970.1 hemolysin family protein [Actinobaculum suis]SDE37246.1 Hemolysin, contains CBS domains [Actinobaculum suis]